MSASILAHAVVVGLAALLAPLTPLDRPDLQKGHRVILGAPPAAAAPPLPGGGGQTTTRRTVRPRSILTPDLPQPEPATEQPPETPDTPSDGPAEGGSPEGSVQGTPEGTEGGSPGGIPGGEPGGTVGGCVGCTGDGPVSDWDQGPRLLFQARPVYPQEAFIKKVQGMVLLEMLIDVNGEVVDTRVLRSISADLDRAAVQAVRQWRFAPALRRGRPVAVWAQAPVQFTIH